MNLHLRAHGYVVHALSARAQVGVLERPRHAPKPFHMHLAIGMQADDHARLSRYVVGMPSGDSAQVPAAHVKHGIALCLYQGRRNSHAVIESTAIKPDDVN